MTFAALNAAAMDLRHSLCSFVDQAAMVEITVRPPAGECDEASFLRLVAWSYAYVFEAGRVVIPYLLQLPGSSHEASSEARKAQNLVHDLRTWSFHNLGFGKNRDVEISRHVQRWFIGTCGAYPPENPVNWRSCFVGLCYEMEKIILHCQGVMIGVLSAPDDGEATTDDLRRRIKRAWPAHEFHKLVGDAVIRLGMRIDSQSFCRTRLARWRDFLVNIPDSDDPRSHMIRMIERDLLDYVNDVLPINGRDVMKALKLDAGPQIGSALRRARELFRSGVKDPKDLLIHLKKERGYFTE